MPASKRLFVALFIALAAGCPAAAKFEVDTIPTSSGDLRVTFIGHGTLMFQFSKLTIHVDPVSRYADYSKMPKADIILVTHEHPDHLDPRAIRAIQTSATSLILTDACHARLKSGTVMKNGDVQEIKGLRIEAVPAYNIVHERSPGNPFHPKGVGNGYIITFGDRRVYIAGDTENIPEMANCGKIDCVFLPMNLPYTMTPEMTAAAAKTIKPRILYPYHFGETDTSKLVNLLKNEEDIDVRIRKMK